MKKHLILIFFLALTLPSALKAETALTDTPFLLPGYWIGSDIFNPEMHIIPDPNPETGMVAIRWMDDARKTTVASYKLIANFDTLTILLVEVAGTDPNPNVSPFQYWAFAYYQKEGGGANHLSLRHHDCYFSKMTRAEFDNYTPPSIKSPQDAINFFKSQTKGICSNMSYSYISDGQATQEGKAFLAKHQLPDYWLDLY